MYINKADVTIYQRFIAIVMCRVYHWTFQILFLFSPSSITCIFQLLYSIKPYYLSSYIGQVKNIFLDSHQVCI